MSRLLSIFFLLLIFSLQSCYVPMSTHKPSSYINNDSTAIFSTHKSRPFKYGFAYSEAECKLYFEKDVTDYEIKNGDVIADVGAASGWMEGIFSVLVDSVTFYAEDIDTNLLNRSQFDNVVNYYNKVRGIPQTNSLHYVIGTLKQTNLPDSIFDKIIFNNSFHEIYYQSDILEDVSKKLKRGGKIMIGESFSNGYKNIRHQGCNVRCNKTIDVIELLKEHGYYLTKMTEPQNSFWNYLVFQKDINASNKFYDRKNSVEPYISELDKLNDYRFAKDSVAVTGIGSYLSENRKAISSVFVSLEIYLNSLGYQWLKEKKIQCAINIFKLNVLFYPDSYNVYDSLGEAYMKNRQYDIALSYYSKSVDLNPYNSAGKEKIKKLKTNLGLN